MNRLTISLPGDAASMLAREAARDNTSVSDIVRRALDKYFGLSDDKPRKLPFASLGRSGQRQTARKAEEILAREWGGRSDVRRR